MIGADSHTCTYVLRSFATGVGSTDMAAGMATGEAWFRCRNPKIRLLCKLQPYVGEDLILHTIGDIGVDGARYMAMEFTGEVFPVYLWIPLYHV